MFKISKKSLATFCVAALLTGVIAGCGGGDKKAPADANEIVIGGNFELTGGVASYGQSNYNGVKMAIDQFNEAGGLNGKKIKFVVTDNKSESSEAMNATVKLISQDKAIALIGPSTSAPVLASAQVVTDKKIPLLTPTGTNEKITVNDGKVREYLFRSCFIDPLQGNVMGIFAANTLKAKNAAIFLDSSSDYSKSIAAVFTTTFEGLGGKVVSNEAFLAKDTDFRATLTKIKQTNPDVVFVPAYYQEAGMIVRQAREMGINATFLGVDGWDSPKLAEIAGADVLNNTFFCNHYSSQNNDPMIEKFVAEYKKKFNQEPDAFAALGYDGGLVMIDAIKRAKTLDSKGIRDALEQTKNLKVVTGNLSIDENHNSSKDIVIIEMKDGKQMFKEKISPK